MTVATLILTISVLGILYAYAGYPLLLLVLARIRPRPVQRSSERPGVTLVVPAHNEQEIIAAKLESCLAQRYPAEKLEILVVSDGSTDATESIVRNHPNERVRLLALPRSGKLNALNHAACSAYGDVLVFSDANVLLDADAVAHLVSPFADPAVGCVCGEKRAIQTGHSADATAGGEGLYWRYDQAVKRLESASGTLYGADGALYAIRAKLFVAVEELAQADDLAISGRVAVQGFRIVYEPRAVCYEEPPQEGAAELLRKVRVAAHTLRATADLARISPRPLAYWWRLGSHKLARYTVPVWLVTTFAASVWLAQSHPLYMALLVAQILFYALVAAGWLLRGRAAGRLRLLSVPYYFALVNAAATLGLITWARGRRTVIWAPRGGVS